MISGLNCLIASTVASQFRNTYRFSPFARASRYFGKSFIRFFAGRWRQGENRLLPPFLIRIRCIQPRLPCRLLPSCTAASLQLRCGFIDFQLLVNIALRNSRVDGTADRTVDAVRLPHSQRYPGDTFTENLFLAVLHLADPVQLSAMSPRPMPTISIIAALQYFQRPPDRGSCPH